MVPAQPSPSEEDRSIEILLPGRPRSRILGIENSSDENGEFRGILASGSMAKE